MPVSLIMMFIVTVKSVLFAWFVMRRVSQLASAFDLSTTSEVRKWPP